MALINAVGMTDLVTWDFNPWEGGERIFPDNISLYTDIYDISNTYCKQ